MWWRKHVKGGATLVQIREKNLSGRDYLDSAIQVKRITDRFGVPLIVDDRVDIALACNAAGVHVGQSDLPVSCARKLMGPDKLWEPHRLRRWSRPGKLLKKERIILAWGPSIQQRQRLSPSLQRFPL